MIQSITGLVAKTRMTPPAVFALDLNCAIYHCVKRLQDRFPFAPDQRLQWETRLIETVLAYIKQMTVIVAPTTATYIAVDGVAPMAKIKQQRMRRFKSAVAAEEEAQIRAAASRVAYVAKPRWDTNAITPGTAFMGALGSALRAYAAAAPAGRVVVSPADEAGEGEQKIMAWLRSVKPASAVVYGLDADLIVLALHMNATTETQVDLFREELEFGGAGGIKTTLDVEQFLYMDMARLGDVLFDAWGRDGSTKPAFLCDFIALMNLLGNDFVPHGMGLKIRDEGIETLLGLYKHTLKAPLLSGPSVYNRAGLVELFTHLTPLESAAIQRSVKKKLDSRIGGSARGGPEEIALAEYNDLPVRWAADACLLRADGSLKPDWATVYDREALSGADVKKAGEAYLDALAWTLAYYAGEPVDLWWYYPWFHPPRAATIKAVLEAADTPLVAPKTRRSPLTPVEQLAMVLPTRSFHLLPAECAKLPAAHPYAWPHTWGLHSFGRRFLWECEPLIPLIQPAQMKNWLEEVYEAS